MGTCDLSLGHWLGLGWVPRPSPAMREIWLGLVLEFGPAAAALHPVVDRHPLAHVLPIEESESLLQAVDCGPVLLLCAWCTVLAGASLGLAEHMVEHSQYRRRLHMNCSRVSFPPTLPHLVWVAMETNPRLCQENLAPLVDRKLLRQSDVTSLPRHGHRPVLPGSSNYPQGEPDHVQALTWGLQEAFCSDVGAWRLFFELWGDHASISSTIETVAATL